MEIAVDASLPAKRYMDVDTGGLFCRILDSSIDILHRPKGRIIAAEAYLNNLHHMLILSINATYPQDYLLLLHPSYIFLLYNEVNRSV
jgi:hypothetical protein